MFNVYGGVMADGGSGYVLLSNSVTAIAHLPQYEIISTSKHRLLVFRDKHNTRPRMADSPICEWEIGMTGRILFEIRSIGGMLKEQAFLLHAYGNPPTFS